ncbi:type IV secretion system protein VirB4 [Nitrosospira sp. Nsp5]|uniref:Type IV secretion system protein virB4 n=1 Tax=Nitrosospira multiformis TaxID=1231 RepID=A0ABY0TMU7_9PROT|nr:MULTISPECIES: VirB4 family type IV secretion/conjugal transfer ATPase [Nitrosospira]PTR05612.1 type IV secretion system protein VirB4 [Nitrosospira sp. Nsp5]SDR11118.1 type IV secretion system protein VirB4 [Nitrosospira multiformis]
MIASSLIGFLALMIAMVGVLFLAVLYLRIRAVGEESRLKKHREVDAGLSDLLNYAAMVDDGVIVCKSGAFMAAWMYRGEDNASASVEQRNLVSYRINQALSKLGSGWMIHVDAVRRPAPHYPERGLSHFPDPVTAAIDEERRQLFKSLGTMYEGYFVLTLTWFPPLLVQRKFIELMFEDDTAPPDHKAQTRGLIESFKRDCLSIESRLSEAVKLARLGGKRVVAENGVDATQDDFLRWLQFCVTGLDHLVQLPRNPMYLDQLLGGQELWGGVVPRIGGKFMQVVAIEGFPSESYPGILSALAELSCEYRWSSRFIFMDPHEAVAHLEKYRRKWRQKVRGFFDQVFNTHIGVIDQDAMAMVADAEAAMAEVNSGRVAQGYYTSVVVLMLEDRTQLEGLARRLEKAVNALGFTARIETINTLDAYLGSLPGHGVENVRRPLMNTLNLADLLPTSTIWTGLNEAPCPMYPPNSPALMYCVTQGATPFRLNTHVRDVGHTFVFGPTGSGKSTLLGAVIAQARRYRGMTLYCFDKGMSLYPLAKAAGARHFTVSADTSQNSGLSFCPLQFLGSQSDRAWAMEWIDALLALNGLVTTPAQRNEIGLAIGSMHKSGSKTLSEFFTLIQDSKVRETLKVYTVEGSMGYLLDAQDDGLSLSDFTVFEIEELMNLGDRYALPVLLYLFRRIEMSLKGQPAMIVLDEAWIMLGHKVFREKIREWLKVLRKANCMVLMATQSLTDAVHSGILDVIVESTATKIFLPNVYAQDQDTAALYRRMGLNDRQIEILATAVQKRQYYYVSEMGRRLYEMALGPLALAFIGSTDKESVANIKALEAKHGNEWVQAWLAMRELDLSDYNMEEAA